VLIEIRPLDRETLLAHLDDALAIERAARAELGDAYSHEEWDANAFLAERPGKWRLSAGAFADGRLVGFLVGSAAHGELHLHRVAVTPPARRLSVARPLMLRAEAAARAASLPSISLSVAEENAHALAFYRRLGYRPLERDALRAYAAARGIPAHDEHVSPGGRTYLILRKSIDGGRA